MDAVTLEEVVMLMKQSPMNSNQGLPMIWIKVWWLLCLCSHQWNLIPMDTPGLSHRDPVIYGLDFDR